MKGSFMARNVNDNMELLSHRIAELGHKIDDLGTRLDTMEERYVRADIYDIRHAQLTTEISEINARSASAKTLRSMVGLAILSAISSPVFALIVTVIFNKG